MVFIKRTKRKGQWSDNSDKQVRETIKELCDTRFTDSTSSYLASLLKARYLEQKDKKSPKKVDYKIHLKGGKWIDIHGLARRYVEAKKGQLAIYESAKKRERGFAPEDAFHEFAVREIEKSSKVMPIERKALNLLFNLKNDIDSEIEHLSRHRELLIANFKNKGFAPFASGQYYLSKLRERGGIKSFPNKQSEINGNSSFSNFVNIVAGIRSELLAFTEGAQRDFHCEYGYNGIDDDYEEKGRFIEREKLRNLFQKIQEDNVDLSDYGYRGGILQRAVDKTEDNLSENEIVDYFNLYMIWHLNQLKKAREKIEEKENGFAVQSGLYNSYLSGYRACGRQYLEDSKVIYDTQTKVESLEKELPYTAISALLRIGGGGDIDFAKVRSDEKETSDKEMSETLGPWVDENFFTHKLFEDEPDRDSRDIIKLAQLVSLSDYEITIDPQDRNSVLIKRAHGGEDRYVRVKFQNDTGHPAIKVQVFYRGYAPVKSREIVNDFMSNVLYSHQRRQSLDILNQVYQRLKSRDQRDDDQSVLVPDMYRQNFLVIKDRKYTVDQKNEGVIVITRDKTGAGGYGQFSLGSKSCEVINSTHFESNEIDIVIIGLARHLNSFVSLDHQIKFTEYAREIAKDQELRFVKEEVSEESYIPQITMRSGARREFERLFFTIQALLSSTIQGGDKIEDPEAIKLMLTDSLIKLQSFVKNNNINIRGFKKQSDAGGNYHYIQQVGWQLISSSLINNGTEDQGFLDQASRLWMENVREYDHLGDRINIIQERKDLLKRQYEKHNIPETQFGQYYSKIMQSRYTPVRTIKEVIDIASQDIFLLERGYIVSGQVEQQNKFGAHLTKELECYHYLSQSSKSTEPASLGEKKFEEEIQHNNDNPTPETPYRGIGVKVNVRDFGGDGRRLIIDEIFSEELIDRFGGVTKEQLIGAAIMKVTVGGGELNIDELLNQDDNWRSRASKIAEAFHSKEEIKFTIFSEIEGEIEVTCDNRVNKSAIYTPIDTSRDPDQPKFEAASRVINSKDPAKTKALNDSIKGAIEESVKRSSLQSVHIVRPRTEGLVRAAAKPLRAQSASRGGHGSDSS